ncbi:uncharacterized protein LOC18425789 isoform X1 [Amborella trichopoda]|uniref:uncharacterized protein LOC18425789 isoform X1 n=1 Tax=Amborella trichopoda TaxID=13333 RepID=UPI0005D37847|nr:uncharacterized protein LOC18425789 isoform X1 [Amborella trichopoda]XP_011629414.1 uncharacterized protein LOC18425789 isoform X1 [Amborella trichopoda]XP_020517849.1 uncharacterized protein LOC18425789 isoform X1 [Amborella trichopoda]XP_020517850.1 uncharacterized protein LOC18425789 isoform X1 [Amborella trichopoda]XP_020517851.1 uncharacterized protein LOC18425789 isoform X1 [Amborella trichopoda]XP_020517852.1 uncharacterized protein LOC18425789 isoform X1 [Amborella trichopoda]|eukprot:XP_011629412.1 uncharacterized protein LOC18425789 isoform X1 [Amborella trichopoda]
MDDGSTNPIKPRKFMPKMRPKRVPNPAEVKRETIETADEKLSKELLKLIKQRQEDGGRLPKIEKKGAPVQVAFGYGNAPNFSNSSGYSKGSIKPKGISQAFDDGGKFVDLKRDVGAKQEKEYVEPWDYHSKYPVAFPLRRPYSGDPVFLVPEILDEEEFGESSASKSVSNKDSINAAEELGVKEEREEPRLLFFQLPETFPVPKRSATAEGNEAHDDSGLKRIGKSQMPSRLEDLQTGFMGKLLIYESGAVKLKIGDTLFNVSPGS